MHVILMVEECGCGFWLSTDKGAALAHFFAGFASKTSSPFLKSTVTRLWSATSPEMSWRKSGNRGLKAFGVGNDLVLCP
jgi:hypothetical protein